MNLKYIDVHCHLNLHELEGDTAVIERMREEGIGGIVVGVDAESSREAVRLAGEHEHLWATIGVHPHYVEKEIFDESVFETLVKNPNVVAIGECGLDYFRPEGDVEKIKQKQCEELEKQVEFAKKHNLPLMVHCRPSKGSMDAYSDFTDFIEPHAKKGLRGNMHFFVGNLEVARRFWSIGFTTSFTGVLTFTHDYDEVVRQAPLEMILTETDAPYVAPAPHRGRVNEPAFVPLVLSAIARTRSEEEEAIRRAVLENAGRLFGLFSKNR